MEIRPDTLADTPRGTIPVQPAERDATWYDKRYKTEKSYWLPATQSSYLPVWNKVLEKIDRFQPIVDLGCGSGQFANLAISRGYTFLYGIDHSRVALEVARELNPGHENQFFQLDIRLKRHYPVGSVVVMTEVLEHIKDDLGVISNLKREQHIVFSLPSYMSMEWDMDWKLWISEHLRIMENKEQIRERYGELVNIKSIDEIMMVPKNDWKIWVVDGLRV